jgi:hypothetical protein
MCRTALFCFLMAVCTWYAPGQEKEARTITQFFNAEGSPVSRIWFIVNKLGFSYRGESDAQKRLDVNEEEESVLLYDEGGVRKTIRIMVRLSFENGPPVESRITKEHEIRRLTILCDFAEGEGEEVSFERSAEDFAVVKGKDAVRSLEGFTYRGVTFTPGVRYFPLQDLAGSGYIVKMDGIWFDLTYAR